MKAVWESLTTTSQDIYKHGEPVYKQELCKNFYPNTNGSTSSHMKHISHDRFDSSNENDAEHILTNGHDSFLTDTDILANGDGLHIDEIEPESVSTSEQEQSELDILTLAREHGFYFPNLCTETPEFEHNHSLSNGKVHQKGELGPPTFDCALKALVWATQGKDPAVASCMKAPKESLPAAPPSLKDADHIQVLVTGSSKLVGVVLSVLLPNMND